MAVTVRAECGDCGIVLVGIDECVLVRIVDTALTSTAFVCPVCTLRCVQTTRKDHALQLAARGARLLDITRPDELDDPVRGDLAVLALDDEWLEKLAAL
jgi:hypothetical protein